MPNFRKLPGRGLDPLEECHVRIGEIPPMVRALCGDDGRRLTARRVGLIMKKLRVGQSRVRGGGARMGGAAGEELRGGGPGRNRKQQYERWPAAARPGPVTQH